MKNQDKEIKNSILKAINEHKSEIFRYKKMLILIDNNGKLDKVSEYSKSKSKPKKTSKDEISELTPIQKKNFPLLDRKKPLVKNNKLKYRNNLQPVSWDKLILPLLKNSLKPMNAPQMVAILFKYKKQGNRKVLNDRIYGALCYLKNKGLIKSEKINGKACYSVI